MATAVAYDQWEDAGLAFSEDQLKNFSPTLVAAARVNWMVEQIPIVLRRADLAGLPKWWQEVARKMEDVMGWYCVVAVLPAVDRVDLHSLVNAGTPAERKKQTLAAHSLGTEMEFLNAWHTEVRGTMIELVTLGRRCSSSTAVSGWKKADKKMANKVANAVDREAHAIDVLRQQLVSRTPESSSLESS